MGPHLGQFLLRRSRRRRLAAALDLGLHPGGVDICVRLDRRVEIAIERVRAIGLALHVATQCGGLGTRLVKLVLKAVNADPGSRQARAGAYRPARAHR